MNIINLENVTILFSLCSKLIEIFCRGRGAGYFWFVENDCKWQIYYKLKTVLKVLRYSRKHWPNIEVVVLIRKDSYIKKCVSQTNTITSLKISLRLTFDHTSQLQLPATPESTQGVVGGQTWWSAVVIPSGETRPPDTGHHRGQWLDDHHRSAVSVLVWPRS